MLIHQDIERIIHEHSSVLREKFTVARLGIFGSYAVNEQTEESDVDILVEFSEPVDRDEILREVVYV
jgi:uncharacterized protein